jgi:hypothetical protein
MNNIQVEQFNKKLKDLGAFTKDKKKYSELEIIDWVAECIGVFYEIGVDTVVVRHFLDYFSFGTAELTENPVYVMARTTDVYKTKCIGPFYEATHQESGSSSKRVSSGHYTLEGSFYYARIAFASARKILENKNQERKIVPIWLIDRTREYDELRHITSSLELIEEKYEKFDANGLATEATTLLQSVLDLNKDNTSKDKLGSKLNSLVEDEKKREDFGVSKDLVIGLNCARLIRNEKVVHKDVPLKYEIPFMVTVSFAYLVLFFVECAILKGKIINYDKK